MPNYEKLTPSDLAQNLTSEIEEYVATSPNNCMPFFPGEHIWDKPLIGFADGDDPLFLDYKKIIGDFHLTPREALELQLKKANCGYFHPAKISVISFVLPSTRETRESLRRESQVCSLRWNYTRHFGQELIFRLERRLVARIEDMGRYAVAPDLQNWFEVKREVPTGFASTWSQRHIAFAAGLGTFSLNDGFITPVGIAVRAGSIVCDLEIAPGQRRNQNHLGNCLFFREGECGKCIKRCPAQAISEKGHDKLKCQNYMNNVMRKTAAEIGRTEPFVGAYMGCGFCQTGVPCEGGLPLGTRSSPSGPKE
jgi:epoxyqueuosine reductase